MKASELRIGNIIQYSEDSVIFKVIGVHEYGLDVENDIETTYIELDQFEPIPLTEEWLFKFGFKKDGKYNSSDRWMGIFNQPLIMGNGYLTIPNYPLTEIKYVHQLQNLYFALTGQELEIK